MVYGHPTNSPHLSRLRNFWRDCSSKPAARFVPWCAYNPRISSVSARYGTDSSERPPDLVSLPLSLALEARCWNIEAAIFGSQFAFLPSKTGGSSQNRPTQGVFFYERSFMNPLGLVLIVRTSDACATINGKNADGQLPRVLVGIGKGFVLSDSGTSGKGIARINRVAARHPVHRLVIGVSGRHWRSEMTKAKGAWSWMGRQSSGK